MRLNKYTAQSINVSENERWVSLIGGSALMVYGLMRRSTGGLALALLGGDLVYRGATGHCHLYEVLGVRTSKISKSAATSVPYGTGIRVEKAVTVNKSPEELYRFWRDLENLPRFMHHLESVKIIDDKRSHWVAKGLADAAIEWDAEIINEIENKLIGWRSLEGANVNNAGSVVFEEAPGGRGTTVRVLLEYSPLGGVVGAAVAKLFGKEPEQQIQEDLRRFKQLMEAGEIPTTQGQPSGRRAKAGHEFARDRQRRMDMSRAKDVVQEASEESFPASDAPSWTARRAGSSSA